ncbi:MAG: hypothetical protein K1000chlam3_00659 [Chlamydiae bacterium]|nr:hypothetical protein [Chlamydiota bacterium]
MNGIKSSSFFNYTFPAAKGDIHSLSYEKNKKMCFLVVSLRNHANLQTHREGIFRDVQKVTYLKWKIRGEYVFSVLILDFEMIQNVVRQIWKQHQIPEEFANLTSKDM